MQNCKKPVRKLSPEEMNDIKNSFKIRTKEELEKSRNSAYKLLVP